MPRKEYTPKNRYVRNSNLLEPDFTAIAWLYVQGAPAPDVHGAWEHIAWPGTTKPPSTKTVSKLYRRLGRYIFMKIMEPTLLTLFPQLEPVKSTTPDHYENFLDTMAETIMKFALNEIDYETFRVLNEGKPMVHVSPELCVEVRRLMASRKGIKADPIPDIALANFRYITAKRIARGAPDSQVAFVMHSSLLSWLEADPLTLSD